MIIEGVLVTGEVGRDSKDMEIDLGYLLFFLYVRVFIRVCEYEYVERKLIFLIIIIVIKKF